MEGFFEQYVTGPFGLVVILPIIGVVASVFLVFFFGFKQLDESKFKKFPSSGQDSAKNKSRRKDNKVKFYYLIKYCLRSDIFWAGL